MPVAIDASEALLWLRSYQAETARLGHEAACVGDNLVARIYDIQNLGGREKVQREHPAVLQDHDRLVRRHQELRKILAERAGA